MENQILTTHHTHDRWVKRNMMAINRAFGKDMSNHYLIIYSSKDEAKKDGMEHLLDCGWCCKFIREKWVLVLT